MFLSNKTHPFGASFKPAVISLSNPKTNTIFNKNGLIIFILLKILNAQP